MTTINNEALFQERLERIKKAIALEPVDRIPVIFAGMAAAPRLTGMKLADFVNDPEAQVDTVLRVFEKYPGFDGVNAIMPGKLSAGAMGFTRLKMPGRELPEDALWQVEEVEIMKPEDYDLLIEKGWAVFEAEMNSRINTDMAAFQENMAWIMANGGRSLQKIRDAGYVIISGISGQAPLEDFAAARTTTQLVFDLYRKADKVQAAMDAAMPGILEKTVMMQKMAPTLGAWVGGWRGAPAFINSKLWNRFFFPYYKQIVEKLVEIGVTPVLHLDQCWDRELERLLELPAKKCLLNPDGMTDLRKFKKICGDHMAVMGDVPSNMFALGTPDEIRNYVRDLVRDVGPTGLILCPGCDAPVNTKPENMEAFVTAAQEFGKA